MRKKEKITLVFIFLIAILVGLFLSPLASTHPDGLEKVAQDYGFIGKARNIANMNFLIPEYEFPGIESEFWKTAVSGFVGVIMMALPFLIVYLMIGFFSRKMKNKAEKGRFLK